MYSRDKGRNNSQLLITQLLDIWRGNLNLGVFSAVNTTNTDAILTDFAQQLSVKTTTLHGFLMETN